MFGSVVSWSEQIKGGKARGLAVTSATRTKLLPDLPPIGEFVPGYQGFGWQGIRVQKVRRQTLSTSSIARSMRGLPIPSSKPSLRIWARKCFQARPRNSANSSRITPRNGRRSSAPRASRPSSCSARLGERERDLSWPDIAQSAAAILVAFFSTLLVVAALTRIKPIRDRIDARVTEIERRLAEKERDRQPVGVERIKDGDE
jgi:hypothetical protein